MNRFWYVQISSGGIPEPPRWIGRVGGDEGEWRDGGGAGSRHFCLAPKVKMPVHPFLGEAVRLRWRFRLVLEWQMHRIFCGERCVRHSYIDVNNF
jgi:hypothetical protein